MSPPWRPRAQRPANPGEKEKPVTQTLSQYKVTFKYQTSDRRGPRNRQTPARSCFKGSSLCHVSPRRWCFEQMQVLATTLWQNVARGTFLFGSMRAYWRHPWRGLFSGCVNYVMQTLWDTNKGWTQRLCCLHVRWFWLCNTMDCSPPGSCVHRIFQARLLEQVAVSYSRGSSHHRDRPLPLAWHVLHCRQLLYHWHTWEAKRLCPLWKKDGVLASPNPTKQWDTAVSTKHVIV